LGDQFGPRSVDHRLRVLFGQGIKLMISVDGGLDGGGLVAGNVAGEIFALFPDLELVIGTLWAFTHHGQFAAFHALDLSDLFEKLSGMRSIHEGQYLSI
jgi:hypothetical protein